LRREVGELAVEGASRLLGREIDPRTHADLLDKLSAEVARG
jgi:F0F1-type ATP synthase membrane subunit b/b'